MNMDVSLGLFVAFGFALVRWTGFFLGLPNFGSETAPVRTRLAAALGLSLATVPVVLNHLQKADLIQTIFGEFLVGLFLGFIIRLPIAAIEWVAEMVGQQAGFGFAHSVNPLGDAVSNPLGQLWVLLAGVLFFSTGIYREALLAFFSSYEVMTVGTGISFWQRAPEHLTHGVSQMFKIGLRIGWPLVTAMAGAQLCLGLLTKIAPQLNIWSLGFLLSAIAALAISWLSLPTLADQIHRYFELNLLALR